VDQKAPDKSLCASNERKGCRYVLRVHFSFLDTFAEYPAKVRPCGSTLPFYVYGPSDRHNIVTSSFLLETILGNIHQVSMWSRE